MRVQIFCSRLRPTGVPAYRCEPNPDELREILTNLFVDADLFACAGVMSDK